MKHILIPAAIIMSIAFSQNVLAQSDDKTIADCLDAANIKPQQPQHTGQQAHLEKNCGGTQEGIV